MVRPRRNVVREFADYFGEETNLDNWQKLCELLDLGSKEELNSMNKCREVFEIASGFAARRRQEC